jgi:hypothetical protein
MTDEEQLEVATKHTNKELAKTLNNFDLNPFSRKNL